MRARVIDLEMGKEVIIMALSVDQPQDWWDRLVGRKPQTRLERYVCPKNQAHRGHWYRTLDFRLCAPETQAELLALYKAEVANRASWPTL